MADETSTNADAPTELKRVRPTLYVALGGTGKEVLLLLRRRILETLWNGHRVEKLDDFKVASFLYFDLYQGKAEEEKKTASGNSVEDPLSALVDLPKGDCIQTRMDTGKYLKGREIDRFPHVKEWLPAGDLRSIRAEDGAGQVRALSRLFFFDDVGKINDAINSKAIALLNNVSNSDALQRLGVEVEPQVQVIVVCSVAGGTGSGSFIDMGYLAKSIQSVQLDGVSLYALLGGAFADLSQRTRANSYAALMELDYCMQGNPSPPYVSRWTDTLENRAAYPYDNVYLVDSRNLGNQGTGDRGHLYRMIADVLFEDLRDPQLRGKKREDLVNQNTNYRLEPFSPPMPKDLEALSLAFSRAYSSVGQCTLTTDGRTQFERDTAQAAHSMLTAFFRTEAADKVNTPQTGERDDLMRNALFLDRDSFFQDFPDFLTPKPSAIADTPLTGRILTTGQVDAVSDLRAEIRGDFEQLRGALPNRSDWRGAVEQLRSKRERDILGDITQVAQFGPRMLMLQEQANHIYADWNKQDGLRTAFYARIDNAELGGIVYTQRLIQQIQDQIIVEKDGFVARTARAAEQYDALAKSLIEGFYTRALENLSKAVKKNWLGNIDNDAIERCMQQLETSLFYYLQYKLRSAACAEAVKLLGNLVRLLGHSEGARGQAGPSGIVGEIEQGSQSVALTLRAIDQEIKVLDESVRGAGPMSQVIRGGRLEGSLRGDYAAWGREALSSQGGSRQMFERLKEGRDARGDHQHPARRGARAHARPREPVADRVADFVRHERGRPQHAVRQRDAAGATLAERRSAAHGPELRRRHGQRVRLRGERIRDVRPLRRDAGAQAAAAISEKAHQLRLVVGPRPHGDLLGTDRPGADRPGADARRLAARLQREERQGRTLAAAQRHRQGALPPSHCDVIGGNGTACRPRAIVPAWRAAGQIAPPGGPRLRGGHLDERHRRLAVDRQRTADLPA